MEISAPQPEITTNDYDKENLIDRETQKNSKKIKCLRCDSYILQPNSGVFKKVEEPILLPSMKSKRDLAASKSTDSTDTTITDNTQIQMDKLDSFWLINDMLVFENIGFTNAVDNMKYLICADCEIGPVGVQNLDKPNEFLVAFERVKYV